MLVKLSIIKKHSRGIQDSNSYGNSPANTPNLCAVAAVFREAITEAVTLNQAAFSVRLASWDRNRNRGEGGDDEG